MHALEEYGLMHVKLYEDIARHGRIATTYAYPVKVEGRYVMDPSPTPKFDNPKMHMSPALQLFGAGREKRIYAIPPFTEVVSLDFEDHPFEVQSFDEPVRAVRGGERLSRRGHPGRPRRAHVRVLGYRSLRDAAGRGVSGEMAGESDGLGARSRPSVLPDISPARGEIGCHPRLRQSQTLQDGAGGEAANLPPCGGDVRQDRGGRLAVPSDGGAAMTDEPLLRVDAISKFYGARVGCRECQLRSVAGRGAGGGRRVRAPARRRCSIACRRGCRRHRARSATACATAHSASSTR